MRPSRLGVGLVCLAAMITACQSTPPRSSALEDFQTEYARAQCDRGVLCGTMWRLQRETGTVLSDCPAELAATLRSMGLVPNAEGGAVKLSIEFSNT